MTLWLSRVRVLEHGVRRRLYARARETLEVVLVLQRVSQLMELQPQAEEKMAAFQQRVAITTTHEAMQHAFS